MNERLANNLAFISTGLCIGILIAWNFRQAQKINRLEETMRPLLRTHLALVADFQARYTNFPSITITNEYNSPFFNP